MNIERRLISFGIFALPLSPLPPVLDVYGSKELFGQSTKGMRAQLRSRNKLVEGMQESLWYMLLDALEQRHLFGRATECRICPPISYKSPNALAQVGEILSFKALTS